MVLLQPLPAIHIRPQAPIKVTGNRPSLTVLLNMDNIDMRLPHFIQPLFTVSHSLFWFYTF